MLEANYLLPLHLSRCRVTISPFHNDYHYHPNFPQDEYFLLPELDSGYLYSFSKTYEKKYKTLYLVC